MLSGQGLQKQVESSTFSSLVAGFSKVRIAGYAVTFALIQLGYHTISAVPLSIEYVVLAIAGGALAAWLLNILFRSLPLNLPMRLVTIWSALFIIQMFADLIEGAFFTTRISTLSIFLGGTFASLGITFLESLIGVLLFPSASDSQSLRDILTNYFPSRVWLLRLTIGSVAYFPVYFMFGALVSPFVLPYYTNSSLGLGLIVPSLSILIPIELLRGVLFVSALVPLIVSVRLSRSATFVFLALFLYLIGAYIPFVAGTTLPWTLKIDHSLEIFADSVVYGAILTYLFKPRRVMTSDR